MLTTRNCSGQVKPSNSTGSSLRMVLRPPSAPISQLASIFPGMPSDSKRTSTESGRGSKPVTRWPKCTSALGSLRRMSSWIGVRRCCSRCSRYGIRRDVGEQAEVELGHHAAAPAAHLPAAHLQPVLVHARRDAVGRHHFLRRRMEAAGAQVVGQRRLGFAHHHAHALAGERQRAHQPGGPGARDHHRKRWRHRYNSRDQ